MRRATVKEMQEAGLLFDYHSPYIANGYVVDGVLVAENVFHPNRNEFPIPHSKGRVNFHAIQGLSKIKINVGDRCQAIINQSSAYLNQPRAKESNMNENGYQGYKNYQTWNVALWIGNKYSQYHYWQERAKMIKDVIANGDCKQVQDGIWTAEKATRYLLADEIEAMFTVHPLADDATMYSDILGHALGQVDWHEVADSILEE